MSRRDLAVNEVFSYATCTVGMADVIAMVEATREEDWIVDRVLTDDGGCFFAHLFAMGNDDAEGSLLWDWFETTWSTTYAAYPVNDGQNPDYPQPTPRQRMLAYLHALWRGDELTTLESMDDESRQDPAAPDTWQPGERETWRARIREVACRELAARSWQHGRDGTGD